MTEIPILKNTVYNYEKVFLDELNITNQENFFDIVFKYYPSSILDIFSYCLEDNSHELNYLNSEYFRLCNEEKYLKFITEAFLFNENICYVKINFSNSDYSSLLQELNNLDVIDKHIMLHQIISFHSSTNNYFLIDNINLLKMFMKGILREFLRVDLYFPKKPMLLFSNYDLSLPLVFKNNNDLHYYKNIANNNDLYFR